MKALARVVLLLGAVGVGAFLLRASLREVTLVYGLPPGEAPARLEVDIRRGGELVRHAELRVPGDAREVRHALRLPDGEYRVVVRAGSAIFERDVTVTEAGTVVLPLRR